MDDNFIENKKLAKELLREIARWGRQHDYPIDFNTEVSLNVAQDDELLELLRDAHFTSVSIGIESPRKESLEETRKGEARDAKPKPDSAGRAGIPLGVRGDAQSSRFKEAAESSQKVSEGRKRSELRDERPSRDTTHWA